MTRCVAVYLSNDGEVDLQPTIERLRSKSISIVVPRIDDREMSFVAFERDAALKRNKWRIAEPQNRAANVECDEIDIALIPLVGFNDAGDRLGRGGGYYDRYFDTSDGLLIGIAHELQRVPNLRPQAWDRQLDVIVTENGWRLCTSRSRDHLTNDLLTVV